MYDNAPIHTAGAVTQWFQDIAIPLVNWPPYFLDLNPVEHVWFGLKQKVLELHSELQNIGKREQAKQALKRALIEA
jgi:hypothetical protein